MTDLFFAVKINDAAKKAGFTFTMAKTPESALTQARDGAGIMIFDLNCEELDQIKLIRTVKQDSALSGIRTVAFVSHIQEDLVQAARDAGCEDVMARSRFVTAVNQLFN